MVELHKDMWVLGMWHARCLTEPPPGYTHVELHVTIWRPGLLPVGQWDVEFGYRFIVDPKGSPFDDEDRKEKVRLQLPAEMTAEQAENKTNSYFNDSGLFTDIDHIPMRCAGDKAIEIMMQWPCAWLHFQTVRDDKAATN